MNNSKKDLSLNLGNLPVYKDPYKQRYTPILTALMDTLIRKRRERIRQEGPGCDPQFNIYVRTDVIADLLNEMYQRYPIYLDNTPSGKSFYGCPLYEVVGGDSHPSYMVYELK